MGMSIFGGILAGALVLSGFLTLDTAGLTQARAGLLAAFIFACAGGLFGVAFAWYITGGRLPKLTLGRLFASRLKRMQDARSNESAP